MNFLFSIIIPVYNRPKEIEELLESALEVKNIQNCEIIIIEDGSLQTCEKVLEPFNSKLNISYYFSIKIKSYESNSRKFTRRVRKNRIRRDK
jgi:glycosyltransferase involved in cell wall biosynthesis